MEQQSMSTDICPYCSLSQIAQTEFILNEYSLKLKIRRLQEFLEQIAEQEIITTNGTNMGCPTCDSPSLAKRALRDTV
jgi:RNA polymerase subunit RPABC4/transcription elongation factor Spt4